MDRWLAILRRIKAIDVDLYLPGHGDVGTKQNVDEMIGLLTDLQAGVKEAIAKGMSKDAAVQALAFPKYKDWRNAHLAPAHLGAMYLDNREVHLPRLRVGEGAPASSWAGRPSAAVIARLGRIAFGSAQSPGGPWSLDPSCTFLYILEKPSGEVTMRIPISEARRRLPELVRRVHKDAGTVVQITVRDEVLAELRPVLPEPEPGAAARKLVEIMRKLPKNRGRKTDFSSRVKDSLYGRGGKGR